MEKRDPRKPPGARPSGAHSASGGKSSRSTSQTQSKPHVGTADSIAVGDVNSDSNEIADTLAAMTPASDDFGDLPEFEVADAAQIVPSQPVKAQPASGAAAIVVAQPVLAQAVGETSEAGDASEEDQDVLPGRRRRFYLTAVPSWLISLLVHVALILILAAITLDPLQRVISILEASVGESESAIEQFELEGPALDMSEALNDPLSAPASSISDVAMPEISSPMMMAVEPNVDALQMNTLTEGVMPSSLLGSSALSQMSAALNSRSSNNKSEMLERFGGNAASEKAVAMALKWIAEHQAPDGGWNFAHSAVCRNRCKDAGELVLARNGATAMALLPFLGAGQTHIEGQYKQTVKRGLAYLINRMKVTPAKGLPRGSWHEPGGSMYSHGLASITVCEAYAMTGDPDLLQPAQLSLNYLIYAQNERDGGWRYSPKSPGDTSVVGWCVMALKSGKMGNLVVPNSTLKGADQFLDFVSTNNGAYYGYTKPTAKIGGRRATIAVGLLCRMYLGYSKEHPGLKEGVYYLAKQGPKLNDLYYSYYATQVMRHHGGSMWDTWNSKMRDDLLKAQEQSGHASGSWVTTGGHSDKGGRLYSTSLATMILEVYYRHMPLYSERSSDDDFEI